MSQERLYRALDGEKALLSDRPFFVPVEVMKLLGGTLAKYELGEEKPVTMVSEGAYLWSIDNLDAGKGVFNHSCKVARKAYHTAIALKEKSKELGDGRFSNLDENEVAVLGLLHDMVKLHSGSNPKPSNGEWIRGRENLSPEQKSALGLNPNYREISPEADEFSAAWVEKSGLSAHLKQLFKEVVVGHDFPQSKEAIDTPEKMLIQVADYTVAQDFSTVRVRWNDVADRWVKSAVANWQDFEGDGDTVEIIRKHSSEFVYKEGQKPRIEPERLTKAVEVVEKAAAEIYGYLRISEEEMNKRCQEEPAWEAALREAWDVDSKVQKLGQRKGSDATPLSNYLIRNVEGSCEPVEGTLRIVHYWRSSLGDNGEEAIFTGSENILREKYPSKESLMGYVNVVNNADWDGVSGVKLCVYRDSHWEDTSWNNIF